MMLGSLFKRIGMGQNQESLNSVLEKMSAQGLNGISYTMEDSNGMPVGYFLFLSDPEKILHVRRAIDEYEGLEDED